MLSRLLALIDALRHRMLRLPFPSPPVHADPRPAVVERWNGTVMSAETYR